MSKNEVDDYGFTGNSVESSDAQEDDKEDISDNQSDLTRVVRSDKKVQFSDAIDTIAKSRERFSKRDQLRGYRVRRLQHVDGFPAEEKLT